MEEPFGKSSLTPRSPITKSYQTVENTTPAASDTLKPVKKLTKRSSSLGHAQRSVETAPLTEKNNDTSELVSTGRGTRSQTAKAGTGSGINPAPVNFQQGEGSAHSSANMTPNQSVVQPTPTPFFVHVTPKSVNVPLSPADKYYTPLSQKSSVFTFAMDFSSGASRQQKLAHRSVTKPVTVVFIPPGPQTQCPTRRKRKGLLNT